MCKVALFPEGCNEVLFFIFENAQALMCGANAASDVLEIRENQEGQPGTAESR